MNTYARLDRLPLHFGQTVTQVAESLCKFLDAAFVQQTKRRSCRSKIGNDSGARSGDKRESGRNRFERCESEGFMTRGLYREMLLTQQCAKLSLRQPPGETHGITDAQFLGEAQQLRPKETVSGDGQLKLRSIFIS